MVLCETSSQGRWWDFVLVVGKVGVLSEGIIR